MRLISREAQWQYLLAGKATFTIENQMTGNRFTFKVKKKETETGQILYFVSLLSGADNDNDYNYLGTIFFNNEQGQFMTTRGSKITHDASSFKAFYWLFNMLQQGKELPAGVNFYHEGRCGRCGRTLTVPESIESGFGPECIGMVSI